MCCIVKRCPNAVHIRMPSLMTRLRARLKPTPLTRTCVVSVGILHYFEYQVRPDALSDSFTARACVWRALSLKTRAPLPHPPPASAFKLHDHCTPRLRLRLRLQLVFNKCQLHHVQLHDHDRWRDRVQSEAPVSESSRSLCY